MLTRNARAQPNLLFPANRSQVVVQFEAGLDREAVNAGGVRKQVKLKCVTTFLCRRAQKPVRQNNGRLAAKFDHVLDGFGIPRAQMLDDSISVLVCVVRHLFSLTRSLLVPVQRALFPEIEITNQQDGEVYHHFDKAIPSKTAKYVGPRIQENSFYVEQNKNHIDQIVFDREGLPGVSGRVHTAFIGLQLGLGGAPPADQLRKGCDHASKKCGSQQVYDERTICMK